jgi:hypothetical protein
MIAVMIALPIAPHVNSQPESSVRAYVFGPTLVATTSVSSFNVTVVGGPGEEGGNYSISAYLEGSNLTGALPQRSSPHQDTSVNGTFKFNITAPRNAQTVTLIVNATSTIEREIETVEIEYEIDVVKPITISSKISNTGNYRLDNLFVRFHVDGNLVGNQTVETLAAGATTSVSYDWLTQSIRPGRHEVMITVDMNNDGVIRELDGDLVIIQSFYMEYGEIHPAIIVVFGVLMAIVILILFRTVMKKRKGW